MEFDIIPKLIASFISLFLSFDFAQHVYFPPVLCNVIQPFWVPSMINSIHKQQAVNEYSKLDYIAPNIDELDSNIGMRASP